MIWANNGANEEWSPCRASSLSSRKGREEDFYVRERLFGSFVRYFRVSGSADTDDIEATFKTETLPTDA
jgi:HSP20 family molecular chaperone IbpA